MGMVVLDKSSFSSLGDVTIGTLHIGSISSAFFLSAISHCDASSVC